MSKIEEAAQQFYFVQGASRKGIAAAPAQNFFTERCLRFVRDAAEILEEILAE